jgi:hypothetical protein
LLIGALLALLLSEGLVWQQTLAAPALVFLPEAKASWRAAISVEGTRTAAAWACCRRRQSSYWMASTR